MSSGHRHPRPFAPVEAAQHEVVDRADERDVGDQEGDQAADRRQGQRRQLGDARRPAGCRRRATSPPTMRGRQEPAPQVLGRRCRLASQFGGRVEPDERDRAGAVRVARRRRRDRRPWRARGPRSARRPAPGGRARSAGSWRRARPPRAAAGDVDRRARAVRQERVRERRPASFGSGRAADDDEPAAAGDPAAGGRCSWPSVSRLGVDVLPDDPVERAPGLDALGQVGGRRAARSAGATWFWLGSRWTVLTMPPGCSATTPTTSWVASWTVNATLVVAMVVSPSTRATSRSRPNAGGWA